MKQRTAWSWVWGCWTAAVVGSFAALEFLALRRRILPTYSRTLARWFGCAPAARRRRIVPLAFIGFWSWLTLHVVRYQVEQEQR